MGHSGKNDHQEERSGYDLRHKETSKQNYDVLFEGEEICPRSTRGTYQSTINKIETNDKKEELLKKLGLSSEMDISVVHRY